MTPLNTVTVRSRVDGELIAVRYHEGDLVSKGDLLVQIDPRPLQAALDQAEGQLMRDQATLANARIDLAWNAHAQAAHRATIDAGFSRIK